MSQVAIDVRTRPMNQDDVATVAAFMAEDWGIARSQVDALTPILRHLIGQERLRGACVEELEPSLGRWSIVVFGVSGFIPEPVMHLLRCEPTPFASFSLLQHFQKGQSDIFLDEAGVGSANRNGGVHKLTIACMQKYKDPADANCRRIMPSAHKAFRELYSGYRIRTLLLEEWSLSEPVYAAAGYNVVHRFPAGMNGWSGQAPLPAPRSLMGLTAEEVQLQTPGTLASFLFNYRPPRLELTTAERRLLAHALVGMTDAEISERLSLSPNTLKASWRQIYEKFEEKAAHVLLSERNANDSQKRGAEKRRRVVAFINDHLEELRPYAQR